MKALLPLAEKIAARLIARKRNDCHCRILDRRADRGGACSAVPGASAYFLGGAVVYTQASRAALLGISDAEMKGMRASTEAYALLCARRMRERHGATWGLGETGATGPTGNRYGDAAGHSCMAVVGPRSNARSRWKPAAPTGGRTWMPLRSARWSCSWKRYRRTRATPPLPPSRRAPGAQLVDQPAGPSASRRARRSSRCRLPALAPARRCGGSSRPCPPSDTAPSARTSALWRFLASTSLAPGDHQPALDQRRERHARRLARGHERRERRRFQRLGRGDALFRGLGVFRFALDADETAAELLGDRAGGAGAAERVEHQIVGPRARQDDARQQRFRLLGRVQLLAVARPSGVPRRCTAASVQSERTWMSSLPALSAS